MTFTSVNPHDPADVVGEWENAGSDGAQAAVGRALKAARVWRDTPGAARAKALGDAASAIEQRGAEVDRPGRAGGRQAGLRGARRGRQGGGDPALLRAGRAAPDGETLPAADPDQLLLARHVPVGVAALLTPWNFPVAIPLWKAAPSLAYGNATLLKPSSAAAATALLLAEIIAPFLPADVFQVVLGGGETAGAADRPSGCRGGVVHRLVGGRQGDQRAGRPRAAAGCRRRWAGRTRRWCSRAPTSTAPRRRSRTRRWATRGRSARRPAG